MTKRVVIKTDQQALAYLEEVGMSHLHTVVQQDGTTVVVEDASCWRCGGNGFGPWNRDGGRCYECWGRPTKGLTKTTPVQTYARKHRTKARAAERRAEKRRAAAQAAEQAKLAGQRKWCRENGHGDITFAELDAKRAQQRAAERGVSGYVGTVGDKIETTATVVVSITCDTQWGISYLNKLKDDGGNLLVWFTSTVEMDKGARYTVRGTVKEHTEYRGEKQTKLTRCKVAVVDTEDTQVLACTCANATADWLKHSVATRLHQAGDLVCMEDECTAPVKSFTRQRGGGYWAQCADCQWETAGENHSARYAAMYG